MTTRLLGENLIKSYGKTLAAMITGLVLYAIAVLVTKFLSDTLNPAFIVLLISIGLLTVSFVATAAKIANLEWVQ